MQVHDYVHDHDHDHVHDYDHGRPFQRVQLFSARSGRRYFYRRADHRRLHIHLSAVYRGDNNGSETEFERIDDFAGECGGD